MLTLYTTTQDFRKGKAQTWRVTRRSSLKPPFKDSQSGYIPPQSKATEGGITPSSCSCQVSFDISCHHHLSIWGREGVMTKCSLWAFPSANKDTWLLWEWYCRGSVQTSLLLGGAERCILSSQSFLHSWAKNTRSATALSTEKGLIQCISYKRRANLWGSPHEIL